jgi:mannobiose 2-epimerase
MNEKERIQWADEVERHLFRHILPFWSGPAVDRDQGGFHGWLSDTGQPDPARPRGLVLNTRILWTFAAVTDLRPEAEFHTLADRALEWVRDRFWDAEHGGGFWHVDRAGQVRNDTKQVYGQAFGVYSLAQYHLAFGDPAVLERARQWYRTVEAHAHDEEHGGYREAFVRDWSRPAPSLVGGTEVGAVKSMNTHLHVLEAWATLYRARPDDGLGRRVRELLTLFLDKILDGQTHHLRPYFSADWRPLGENTYTYGHDIEAAWLLCEAADALGDADLKKRLERVAVRIAEAVLKEAVGSDGGVAYEGRDGRVIGTHRDWWVQAEALVGFLHAWELSRREEFLKAARAVWDFILTRVADRVHGDWFWRVNERGEPDRSLPKLSEWKGPYHSARACMETVRRLRKLPG